MNKKIIIFIVIAILGFVAYQIIFNKTKEEYVLTEVKKDYLTKKVSETGVVKKGEKIDLSFKTNGRIEKIYVSVGDEVKAGQPLAKLETTQTIIKLQEAEASLALANAQLNKLLAGATAEEIAVSRTKANNAQVSLQNANQNLTDVKTVAQENLTQDYEDALNSLDSAYLKIYNAANEIDSLQRTYFTGNDQESIVVKEKTTAVKNILTQILPYHNAAKNDPRHENIDQALAVFKNALSATYANLQTIRNVFEEITYRDVVSSTDKTSVDTQKTNINTSFTSIVSAQQAIASTKLTNESDINTAASAVLTAEGALKLAQNDLALTLAGPQQADIDLNKAKVLQAQSSLNLLKDQLKDAVLISPVDGQVITANGETGEMVTEKLITLIPLAPFQIEVNVPEVNIGKIKLGQSTEIILDAFEETVFKGQIIKIEPTETILQGVVYYKINSSLENAGEGIKPGMTADVDIIVEAKEGVLIVPQRAVLEKDGKSFVRVPMEKGYVEKEVGIGLKGSQGYVEVVSGLKEGEKIITFIKEK